MSEWKEYLLEEVIEKFIDYRGKTPQKTSFGIPLMTAKIVKGGRLLEPTEFIAKEDYSAWMTRGFPEINDVLLTTEAPLGEVALVKDKNVALGQRLITLQTKKKLCDSVFLKYYLQSFEGQATLQSRASGSTVEGIKSAELKKIEISLPPIREQKSIASILSSLDDKIDLLHRQNATLEKLAETLFRQWFVEEAKEDWEEVKIKDVCLLITKGTTPTTLGKSFKENGINFIKAESLTDVGTFIPEKFAFIDDDTNNLLKRSQIQEGDVLITIAGTIGRIGYVTKDILPANTNQAIGIMRVNREIINPYFLYCLFNSTEIKNDFDGRVVHAVQPNLSLGEIGDIEFKLPPSEVLASRIQKIEGLFIKKNKNTTQIRTLTALRDTLLPKLMSGEVRVSEHDLKDYKMDKI